MERAVMTAALVGTVCNSAPFAIVNAKLTNAEVSGDTRLGVSSLLGAKNTGADYDAHASSCT